MVKWKLATPHLQHGPHILSEGSSSAIQPHASEGSDLFEESVDGGEVEASDVRVPVPFASYIKLPFISSET